VTVTSVSNAPTNVFGVPGYESVALSWSAPTQTGGTPITGYFIRFSTDGGGSWAQLPNTGSTATSFTVTGLTSQAGYIFEVAAINAAGTSAWSQASSLVQPLLDPGAVTDVVATPAYQAVALTWLPPANTAIPVTGYVVRWSDDSGTTWNAPLATGSTATQFTYPGLTQPVPLVFQVAAVNANGQGPWSTASAPVTPDTVPAAPSRLRALAKNRAVLLSWNPPADLAGGTLSGYRIEYQVGSSTEWIVHTASTGTTATQQLIVNLVNGTSYRFRVAAITQLGVGLPSQATADVIPFTVPGAPLGLFAAAGNGTALLAWQPPADDGGRRIVGYRIEASDESGWYELVANTGTNATGYAATGLVNGMAYRFRVAAINAAGVGATSLGSNAVVPAGLPAAPTQVKGTTGPGSIGLQWQAPTNTGGLPITSYVVRWSTNGGVSWQSSDTGGPATSYTIIGLASPATTMVQVAAVTAAGQGAWSVAVSPPAAVTTLTARGLKGGRISLAWQPPATNGGSPLVGYVITVSKNGKPFTTLTTVDAGQTSLLLTGLKRSVRYRFQIQPLTQAWAGPWSAISNPVSPR
jgi:titin